MHYCRNRSEVDAEESADTLHFLNRDLSELNVIDRGQGIIEISNEQQTNFVSDDVVLQLLDQLLLIDDLVVGMGKPEEPVIFNPDGPRFGVQ